MYSYFVSYSHDQGCGRAEIHCSTIINGIDDIEGMEKAILELGKVTGVVILYYQLLAEVKEQP